MNLEDGTETPFMKGAMPALSPQGKRIAFSRYDDRGVWLANVKNPTETLILLDAQGWGTSWSPDGKKVAWTKRRNNDYMIAVVDIVEGDDWNLFDSEDQDSPFQAIYYNFTWSPDSRYIVFKGIRNRQAEIVAVDALEERKPVVLKQGATGNLHNAFAWHPDGKHVLFAQQHPERKLRQFFLMEPLKPKAEPVLVEKLPEDIIVSDPCYTPDGKQIIFAARIKSPPKQQEQPPPEEKQK